MIEPLNPFLAMLKRAQQLHLYLGVLFAPLIVFFAFSGMLMVFHFHEGPKNGPYTPPAWLKAFGAIHKGQRHWPDPKVLPSWPLKWFVAAMALGLIVTTLLGIFMAFKHHRNVWMVVGLIVVGAVLPVLLLYAV